MELAPEPSKHKLASTREYIDQYVAGGQIKLIDVIECGSFGEIYLGQRVGSGEHFAVKIIRPEKRGTGDSILREFGFLSKLEGKGLFPKCRIEYSNMNALKNTVLIMQHLGPSLYDVYRACQKKFSVPTMAYVAVEILKRFKELHCQGIVHRDIKPQNFCLGGENLASIYLIDFGLSKEYRQENGTLVPEDTPAGFVGTPRYASTNSHAKKLQTRRDDVESLGYMMVFLLVGSLPWQSVKTKDKKKKHEELFRIKSAINVEQLCKGLPTVFADLINEARDLEFEEEPPYDYYIKEFGKLSCPAAALDWANLPEVDPI